MKRALKSMSSDNSLPDSSVALVLGGYINGYSIIRELDECGVSNIWLFSYGGSLAEHSNRITGYDIIDKSVATLKFKLEALHERFDRIVVFPTDDLQLELMNEIYHDVASFCFIPLNPGSLLACLDKGVQYEFCENLGVPYPRTRDFRHVNDYDKILELKFPLIIKPNKRDDLTQSVFRNIYVETEDDLQAKKDMLLKHIDHGVEFLASEFVPGDDTRIFAYVGYRSRAGVIVNEWIGKKLTQFPDRFGVFSSASNEAPEVVREQGRKLLEGMDLVGIAEPEFKFDERDGKYKLMEVNLRSMMWHRVGNRSGVHIQYTQWLDAIGQSVPRHHQKMSPRVHFVYMKHELINLFTRRGYWRNFFYNVFDGERIHFAVFDIFDIKPFIYDLMSFPGSLLRQWRRILSRH